MSERRRTVLIVTAAVILAALLAWSCTLRVDAQEGVCAVDADCPPGCVCFEAQCWLPEQVPPATATPTLEIVAQPETILPTATAQPVMNAPAKPPISSQVQDPGRACIPTHAGAPVRLCETGSGSGWWLVWFGQGRSATGPHVFFPEVLAAAGAETGVVLQAENPLTGMPLLVWWNAPRRVVVVLTLYGDEKVYVFAVDEGRRVLHLYW